MNTEEPIGRLLEDGVDEGAAQRVWERVGQKRAARGLVRRYRGPVGVGVAAAIAATALLAWNLGQKSTVVDGGPIALADGSPLPAVMDAKPTPWRLNDGSELQVTDDGDLAVLENGDRRIGLLLRQGSVNLEVEPGGPRRWSVDCGEVRVEVVGTIFSVTKKPKEVVVSVRRGAVLVRGPRVPEGVQRLSAGESISVPRAPEEAQASVSPDISPEVVSKEEPASPKEAPLDPRAKPGPSTAPRDAITKTHAHADWQSLADQRDYVAAYEALGEEGLRQATARAADVAELLVLADVARLSGHPAEAAHPLRRVVSAFSGDPRAAVAAFSLGRVELDVLNAPEPAAQSFETALRLGVPQGLREDALARTVEAYADANMTARAAEAAARYKAAYPEGRFVKAVEKWSAGR